MGGSKRAVISVTGMIAGHAWWYLFCSETSPGASFSRAPGWMKSFVDNGASGGARPAGGNANRTGGGARSGGSGSIHYWGSGQRLGR